MSIVCSPRGRTKLEYLQGKRDSRKKGHPELPSATNVSRRMEAVYIISGVTGGILIADNSREGEENSEGVCKDQ